MKRLILLLLLLLTGDLCGGAIAQGGGVPASDEAERSISGSIRFTNNSPKDHVFLVELFTADAKRRVAVRWTDARGDFKFLGLKPRRYILQVNINRKLCLLQYVVDATKQQPEHLHVFGDADCRHSHVAGVPAPRPIPRNKER
jgi:hypothetical protein